MFVHIVARTLHGARPLAAPHVAWHLWKQLRRAWPQALAACLMPDHLHLIAATVDPDAERLKLAHVLSGCSRRANAGALWERVPVPKLIPDTKHLLRQIRYVHLNPCRDGLVTDPLCWPWSTHRGIVGAEFRPWIDARALSRRLAMPHVGFVEWFHGYVSGDPSVAVSGTPFPRPAPKHDVPAFPLRDVLRAAMAAAPLASKPVVRCGFILLGHDQGWTDPALLSRTVGITPHQIRSVAQRRNEPLLRAAALCLGDPRLRWGAEKSPHARSFPAGAPH